ncbi:MAG: LPS-assembly protein LptD [Acidobacteriota bacterium]
MNAPESMRIRVTRLALTAAFTLAFSSGAILPQESEEAGAAAEAAGKRRVVSPGPGGRTLQIDAGPGSILGKDELLLKEYVDIRFGATRLQADFVRYVPSTSTAHAEGNVIFDHGDARITAESLDYNLESGTGVFHKARGYAEPSYYFEAERVEKISENELVLHDATFTACTQPIPYWSFKVGRALLRLSEYAYLHNLSFKVGRVTVFYTPYLVWPIKTDRASGLLFPEFGFSDRNGTVISNAFYWAMRRNMDATFFFDYWSEAGYGNGVEYRYVPSELGRGRFTGYIIRDQVAKDEMREGVSTDRWVINYEHLQHFDAGWRLIARANFISDFDYYLDFERDIRLSTNPQALSDLYVTRNWGFHSLNIRGERREQLVTVGVSPSGLGDPLGVTRKEEIIRWIQPQIEFRSSRQRLGRSPFFLALESSAAAFDKGEEDVSYQRLDAFPTLSAQLSPVTWLDVDASVSYRDTYYTKSQRTDLGCDGLPNTGDFGEGNGQDDTERDENGDGIFDAADDLGCDRLPNTGDFGEGNGSLDGERSATFEDNLNRNGYQAGLQIIGPKISRVFNRPGSDFSTRYKHTIEPTIRYTYRSEVEDVENVIRFDQIDTLPDRANQVTYALVTRLFARRPASRLEDFDAGTVYGAEYVGSSLDPLRAAREAFMREKDRRRVELGEAGMEEGPEAGERLSTVEIATLEISQDYSFLRPLSRSVALDDESRASPIRATLRLNPSIRTSLDLRTSYDILFRQFREASLSANLRSPRRGFLDLTWSLTRDLEGQALQEQGLAFVPVRDRSQIVLQGETNLFRRRLLLGLQVNYELGDVLPGEPRLRDQRYKLGYNTQCCGFQIEFLERNYTTTSQRELRFLINLKGVGNVVDLQSRSGGGF